MTDLSHYEPWGRSVVGRFADVRLAAATDSTNADARYYVSDGPHVAAAAFLADFQRTGRGRLDRRWEAPPGHSMLLSVCFAPSLERTEWGQYTTALGVAACEVVGAPSVGLKWPNDLVTTDGAKLGGMLAEATDRALVIGFGINVGWPGPNDDGPPGASSLARLDVALSRDQLVTQLLERFSLWCDTIELDPEGGAQLQTAYEQRCFTLGADVRVELAGGAVLLGRATGVSGAGALVVENDAGAHRIFVGDVVHLRPQQ